MHFSSHYIMKVHSTAGQWTTWARCSMCVRPCKLYRQLARWIHHHHFPEADSRAGEKGELTGD